MMVDRIKIAKDKQGFKRLTIAAVDKSLNPSGSWAAINEVRYGQALNDLASVEDV